MDGPAGDWISIVATERVVVTVRQIQSTHVPIAVYAKVANLDRMRRSSVQTNLASLGVRYTEALPIPIDFAISVGRWSALNSRIDPRSRRD